MGSEFPKFPGNYVTGSIECNIPKKSISVEYSEKKPNYRCAFFRTTHGWRIQGNAAGSSAFRSLTSVSSVILDLVTLKCFASYNRGMFLGYLLPILIYRWVVLRMSPTAILSVTKAWGTRDTEPYVDKCHSAKRCNGIFSILRSRILSRNLLENRGAHFKTIR